MTARVGFEELNVRAVIGANAPERVARQQLRITLTVDYNAERAAESDTIDDAVDYSALASLVRTVADEGRYHLLEALCGAVIRRIQEDFPQALRIEITVRKPQAVPGAKAALARVQWRADNPKVAADVLTGESAPG